MDADKPIERERQPAAGNTDIARTDDYWWPSGGTIRPSNLVQAYQQLGERPSGRTGEYFEIVDADGKLQAQADTPFGVKRQAEKLGVDRYQRVAPDGSRAVYAKDGTYWKREPGLDRKVPEVAAAPVQKPAPHEVELAKRYVVEPARWEPIANVDAYQGSPEDVVGQTWYLVRGNESCLAFASTAMSTWTLLDPVLDRDGPSAIRSMVEQAAGRKWDPIEISGHKDFRRAAWLEASLQGLRVRGYEPTRVDLETLGHERRERGLGPTPQPERQAVPQPAGAATKAIERKPEAQRAVLSAIDAVLNSRRVPEPMRKAVMHAASEKLAQRSRNGVVHRVKVYDGTATPGVTRTVTAPTVAPVRELGGRGQ